MRRVFLILAFFLLSLPVQAAAPFPAGETWPVARGPSREPIPYQYNPHSLARVPKDFLDDSVATILHAGSSYLVDPDGTIETIIHEVTRLNGRKGVERLGEFRGVIYTPSYQKLTLNVARIHKASGKIVAVEARHVHLRDVGTDYQVYDPEKQLIISFPALEVGDTIEVKWTLRGKNPEHDDQFFTRYSFGDPKYPVVQDELAVRVPRGRELKFATVNGKLKPSVRDEGQTQFYHWKATNVDRPPRDENLPSKEEMRETVLVSTFTNWDQVGAWKARLRKDCWKCTPRMREVAAEVTKGLKTPTEKARALTYWVRRHVRYVSAGDRHDYTPHAPDIVLANRFGDCKDTSQLLAAMLREIGVQVELATLGARDDGQIHPDVPSPWGTHAILLATIAGKKHWIDTTISLAGWDALPRDDLGRLCYLTDEQGKIRLERTPPPTPEGNRTEQTTEVWIATDGTSRCYRTAISRGLAALSQRDNYVEVPPGEQRRQLASDLQDANSRTRLVRLRVDEKSLKDFDQPVKVEMEFEIPRHFTGSSEREGSFTDSKVWNKLLAYNFEYDREVPLVFPAPFESLHTYHVHLPAAYGLDGVPREKTIKSAWGKFTLTVKTTEDGDAIRHVEVRFHTRLEKVQIEPGDLEDFRKFQEEVSRDYRVYLTLKPASNAASAKMLEQAAFLAPQNTFTALTLAKIYIREGRLAEARRVLSRAAAYHPGDVELQRLLVDAADTPQDEEKAQRELVKRHPENLDHARVLGSILIGQGKQDEARTLLEPLTKKGSPVQRALVHYQLARSYYRKNQLPQALEQLELAFKMDPEAVHSVRVHTLHGQILDESKRPADAIKAYRKAQALDRRNQEVLLSLIRLSLVVKDELAALDYLRRYVLVVEKDAAGLRLAAETYHRMKRNDEALELALRSRELGFHEKTQRLLGLIYLEKGDPAKALTHLDRAEPDGVVLAASIRASLQAGKIRDLDRLVERAERLDAPGQTLKRLLERARAVLSRRADLGKRVKVSAEKQEQTDSALDALVCAEEAARGGMTGPLVRSLLERAVVLDLGIGPTHGLRGWAAFKQGKLREALAESTRAIDLSPEEPTGYHIRGRVRLEREQPGALLDIEKAALLSARQDADILSSLALVQIYGGKHEQALETVKEALKIQPNHPELKEQLRSLEEKVKKK